MVRSTEMSSSLSRSFGMSPKTRPAVDSTSSPTTEPLRSLRTLGWTSPRSSRPPTTPPIPQDTTLACTKCRFSNIIPIVRFTRPFTPRGSTSMTVFRSFFRSVVYLNTNPFSCVGHLSYTWCGINILQSLCVFFLSSFSVSMNHRQSRKKEVPRPSPAGLSLARVKHELHVFKGEKRSESEEILEKNVYKLSDV